MANCKCPYQRDAGRCLHLQGVPGAGGSFGDWCECPCHSKPPAPPSLSSFGKVGEELDRLSTEQVSYERYAAERTIDAIGESIRKLERQKSEQYRRFQACEVILKRRKETT